MRYVGDHVAVVIADTYSQAKDAADLIVVDLNDMDQMGAHDALFAAGNIVVGRDGRLSGPMLAGGLIDGLRKAGCNVTDIGLAPTPLVYFGAYQLRAGSCVSVTGSHNPPDYNGFKMMMGKKSFFGADIQTLGAMAGKGDWETGQGNLAATLLFVTNRPPAEAAQIRRLRNSARCSTSGAELSSMLSVMRHSSCAAPAACGQVLPLRQEAGPRPPPRWPSMAPTTWRSRSGPTTTPPSPSLARPAP